MSSDDEPDYMSEDFLKKCVQDQRPGLVHSRALRRQYKLVKEKVVQDKDYRQQQKPSRIRERERRDEGMRTALGEDNKGYAMLYKMGYKPGTAIGKQGTGMLTPIAVEVPEGRAGLGRAAVLAEVAARKEELRAQRARQRLQDGGLSANKYRAHMAKRRAEGLAEADLRKSQRVCHTLDERQGVAQPAEPWFWPDNKEVLCEDTDGEDKEKPCSGKEEEEEEEQAAAAEEAGSGCELEVSDKLQILTWYLRRTHLYCLWCGTSYEDEDDLRDNCPGTSRDDH